MLNRYKILLIVLTTLILVAVNFYLPTFAPDLVVPLNLLVGTFGTVVVFYDSLLSVFSSGSQKTVTIQNLNYQVVHAGSAKQSNKAFGDLVKKGASPGTRWKKSSFKAYSEIWRMLQRISFAGEALWKAVSLKTISDFANLTEQAKYQIREGSLFIEQKHLEELHAILKRFDKYWVGKSELLDLYRRDEREFEKINRRIKKNGELKHDYENLLAKILVSFREQLKEN